MMPFHFGKRLAPLLVLSVTSLPGARAAPPKPIIKPKFSARTLVPQAMQHIPHWIVGENYVEKIAGVTPRQIVLQIGNRLQPSLGRIVVLDRRTGTLQGDFKSESVFLREQSLSSYWQVLGSVTPEQGDTVTVLQRFIQSTNISGLPSAQVETYGFGSSGYPPRWVYPVKAGDQASENIGGTTLVGDLLLRFTNASVTLWDALTGTSVDPRTLEGNARVQQAVRVRGTPLVQLGQGWQGRLYRLDTGKVLPPFQEPVMDQSITEGGVTEDRALWTYSGDTGAMGSGSRPNYLICTDGQGKKVWQLPDPVVDPNNGLFGTAKTAAAAWELFRSVGNVTLAKPRGKEPVAVVEASGDVYGIRVRDGKMLWSRSYSPRSTVLVAVGSAGVCILRGQYNPRTGASKNLRLEALDVTTGAKRKSWPFTTPGIWLGAIGDDLMTVDDQGNVRLFTGKQLLK